MAKPNDPGRYDQKKAEPVQDQVQEQEEDVTKDANDSEHKQNSQQNALGNSAIQNQMIGSGQPSPGGEAGGGGGMAMRKAGMESDKGFGGDDDLDDDLPLTLEDLVRSWNPGTPKSKDRPAWLEPMPSDELPPEDEAYLAEIKSDAAFRVRGDFTVDSQIQPSGAVMASGMMDWGRAVQLWTSTDLLDRTVARVFVPGASFLHDPTGRALFHRARTGAIGSLLMQRGPTLAAAPSSPTVGFVAFCLELQGHRRHAEMVRIDPGVEGKQMPKTTAVLERCIQGRAANVAPRALPAAAQAHLDPVLDLLLDLEDPNVYLPSMIADLSDDDPDDDPLGLDAILAEFTGGAPDRDEPLYYSAMQAAERLAAATARTRIHVAAASVAIAQVARWWSTGLPLETLHHVAATVDQETDRNLRLLVEVARAAKQRSVPPKGLKAGLKRAVRALRGVHDLARELLSETIGGIVPAGPIVHPRAPIPLDPLESAWADGEPRRGLPWLDNRPKTPGTRATALLIQLTAGDDRDGMADDLLAAAADQSSPLITEVLQVLAGPVLLREGKTVRAHALALEQMAIGESRRNGLLLASAALLGIEALRLQGDVEGAHALHLDAGRRAWALGAPAALTVLARYTPPPEEV